MITLPQRSKIRDSFGCDIVILIVISIIIGSLLASTLSLGANAYFSKALNNLVGDYGEDDFVIQVREETKQDAEIQIQKIIDEAFPGGKMKEGPTITGKTSIFISVPDQYKTKQVYDDLGKTFGSIPGGAGVGVVTEPRLTIRGIPDGAKNMVLERAMQMDGVRFAFRDGASIGVIMTDMNQSAAVNEQIKNMLKQYQVIEISFPVGSEPANPIRLGEDIASAMQSQLKVEYAQNVSVDGQNSDMTALTGTMMELRRFLSAYATQVTITPTAGLVRGDNVAFQGTAANPPTAGMAVDEGNVVVEVTAISADGLAEGRIIKGDASSLGNKQGYKLDKNQIGPYVGDASYHNPRQELSGALTETSKLVGQIPGLARDSQDLSGVAVNALDHYGSSVDAMEKTINSVQAAGDAIQTTTDGLANIDTSAAQSQLANSSQAIDGLIKTLQVARLVNPEAGNSIGELSATQANLDNLNSTLKALDHVSANARQANAAIGAIVSSGNSMVAELNSFDVDGARNSLTDANSRLEQLNQLDVPLISTQLQYMAAAAPNLKDEDIASSVNLLDKFIAGQVIPGERIQILTTSNISTDAVAPIIRDQLGYSGTSLYSTDLGVIEPNARSEVYQLLNEVRAVLAGMTAIVATILFLALDHSAIMTVMRRKRLNNKISAGGWRGVLQRFTITFTAPERRYGMLIGAVLLTAMFIIAHGGIPYVPWLAVPFLGALLGLIVAAYAEKISPVSADEITAGEALGLSFDEIMREIVIPGARPGLLQKLNSRKVKFK